MSKFRIPNKNSTWNPYQEEDQLTGRNSIESVQPDPYSGMYTHNTLSEDQSFLDAEGKYSLYGNSAVAQKAIAESKAYNQGSLELLGKGTYNLAKTVGIEILKTPGYLGGGIAAVGNEVFGDGKNSMSLLVDNAWLNTFDKLDDNLKAAIPTYISEDVQNGNLWDKMGSAQWWATSGADGLGFMLAMFAPGRALAAAGVGAKIAGGAEALANIKKVATGESWLAKSGLFAATEDGFRFTNTLARNADGVAAATINTTVEAAAEAGNTFDNLKNKYLAEGFSEDEAKQKAGSGASAVFKANVVLLVLSNIFDELYIWKTLGSSGAKEAGQSLIAKATKDGVFDPSQLRSLSTGNLWKNIGINYAKSAAKEGFFEEGPQTILQQNIEKGDDKGNVLENVANIASQYLTDFEDNKELHESIFLGGFLGGKASFIQTLNENKALKRALTGTPEITKDNVWAKLGLSRTTPAQKGFSQLLSENHIKQFRSFNDLLDEKGTLDEKKLADAQLDNVQEIVTQFKYDSAIASGNQVEQELYGQFLAANAAQSFLGQEGGKEIFNQYVDAQVTPAWKTRFEETFKRQPTQQELSKFQQQYKKSGERVFNAHKIAEETNYPERYFQDKENPEQYQRFKQEYFHQKFQNLVALDAIQEKKKEFDNQLAEQGLTKDDLDKTSEIKNPVLKELAQNIKREYQQVNDLEDELSKNYSKLFSKEGVKEFYENTVKQKEFFNQTKKEIEDQNEKLKEDIDKQSISNEEFGQDLKNKSSELGYNINEPIFARDRNNNPYQFVVDQDGNVRILDESGIDMIHIDEFEGDLSKKGIKILPKERAAEINDEDFTSFDDPVEIPEASLADFGEIAELGIAETKTNFEDPLPNERYDIEYSKVGTSLYPTSGQHHEINNLGQEQFIEESPGVYIPKLNSHLSQRLWFETIQNININEHQVRIVTNDTGNVDLDKAIRLQNPNPSNRDLYTVLLNSSGTYVIKDGQYIFTSIRQPESLYPEKNGKFLQPRVAEPSIINQYGLAKGVVFDITEDTFNTLPRTELDKLGNPKSYSELRNNAIRWSKDEYTRWFNQNLATPNQVYPIMYKTKGFPIRKYEDKEGTKPLLNKPLGNIPNLKLNTPKNPSTKDLTGGQIQMSFKGYVEIGDETFVVPKGDVVVISNDNTVHKLQPRNLNQDEVNVVLYLLSLRTGNQPTESIQLQTPIPFRINNKSKDKNFVFYDEQNPRASIINTLINFGSQDGKKGEIYFNKQSVFNGKPELVWTDFQGQVNSVRVDAIKQALETKNFKAIQNLVDFLGQKRFNINEHLLYNPKFSQAKLTYVKDQSGNSVPQLEWNDSRSYYDVLLNDVAKTTTAQVAGYPNRLQVNLGLGTTPIPTIQSVETKNNNADAPTKESVTEKLNINSPFYKKVEEALVKLGLIEKYNPDTKTGDLIGGYTQSDGQGGFASGNIIFKSDGSISYVASEIVVTFDGGGNMITENTKEAAEESKRLKIESKKEAILRFEKLKDSEELRYKEVVDVLGNKGRRLKTKQELDDSINKLNNIINETTAELAELEQTDKIEIKPQTDSDLLNEFFNFELPKMDKVLTLDQLIQAKLDSGELIKNCK